MRHRRFGALVLGTVMLSLTASGCDVWPFGPSKSVAGQWRFTFGKWRVFEMTLAQSGNEITGTVCTYALGLIGAAPVSQAPVSGDYPNMRFTDPSIPNCEYDMLFEEDQDEIAGDCGDRSLVRFTRGGSGTCAGATPAR